MANGELNSEFLMNLDKNIKNLNTTFEKFDARISGIGSNITSVFGDANKAIADFKTTMRAIRLEQIINFDPVENNIIRIEKRIDELKKKISLHEENLPLFNKKINGGKLTEDEEKKFRLSAILSDTTLREYRNEIAELTSMRKDYYKTEKEITGEIIKIKQEQRKQEQDLFRKSLNDRNKYNLKIIETKRLLDANQQMNGDKETVASRGLKKQLDDYVQLHKQTIEQVTELRKRGVTLSAQEEAEIRIENETKLRRVMLGINQHTSQEWKERTAQTTKLTGNLENAARRYKNAEQEVLNIEKQITAEQEKINSLSIHPRKNKESIEESQKEIDRLKSLLENTRERADKLASSLASMGAKKGEGAAALNRIREEMGLKTTKEVEAAKTDEERRRLEMTRAFNERDMQMTEQREKEKLAIEQRYNAERTAEAQAENKKRADMERGFAEMEKERINQRRKSTIEDIRLGDIAAQKGRTGNAAALQDTSAMRELQMKSEEEIRAYEAVENGLKKSAENRRILQEQITNDVEKEIAKREKIIVQEAQKSNLEANKEADRIDKERRDIRLRESKQGYNEYFEQLRSSQTVFGRVVSDINRMAQDAGPELQRKLFDARAAEKAASDAANAAFESYKSAFQNHKNWQDKNEGSKSAQQSLGIKGVLQRYYEPFALDYNAVHKGFERAMGFEGQYTLEVEQGARRRKVALQSDVDALNARMEASKRVADVEYEIEQRRKQFGAQAEAVRKIDRDYQNTINTLEKLRAKYEELYVRKEAGLINEQQFNNSADKIIAKYDELRKKKNEFDEGIDIDSAARRKSPYSENRDSALKRQVQIQNELIQKTKEIARQEAAINAEKRNAKKENREPDIKREEAAIKSLRNEMKGLAQEAGNLNKEYRGTTQEARKLTESKWATVQANNARKLKTSIEEIKNESKKLTSALNKLGSAFGIAFSVRSLVNFGKKLIETRGEFEIQQVALRSILQNKQLADEIWEKTMSAALQSPFTAMQLTRYTKQLSAYRIETEKLFDTTKRLADVSAGLGVDMGRLILAYGQVKAANYLRASEIRQFTEAGVNILGELRDYFNDTKGMALSTADVMDKVQKRLVKFEDVEAIFKRLTDQGGIFYNMQYIQSQTLKGQINKLHDAYDQMLNDIGKSNQGVLREFVDTFNSIVKNWRTWSVVIKSIAFGGITVYITRLVQAIGVLSIKGSTASKSIKRLAVDLRNLGRSIKGNITSIGIGSVVALITAFISLGNRMSENNKVIEEQLLRLRETRVGFEKLESKIKANNSKIQNGTKNQKELNEAQKENKAILAKLKDEYPQLASQMSIATNGVIDMNNALTIQNRKLREQATLIAMQSQKNLFSDTMQKNLQEAEGELARKRAAISRMQAEAKAELAKLEAEASKLSNVEFGKLVYPEGTEDILLLTKKAKILKSIVDFKETENVEDDLDEMRRLDKEYSDKNWFERWFGGGSMTFLETGDFLSENVRSLKKSLEEQLPLIAKYYEQAIMDNKTYAEEIKKTSGGFEEWLSKNVDRLNKDAEEGINKANETIIKVFKATTPEGRRMISEAINSYFKIGKGDAVEKAADDLGKVMAQGVSRGFSVEWAKEVKEKSTILSNVKKLIDFFAESTKGSNGGDGSGDESKGDKQKKSVSSMVSLLKEMNDEYNKLSKSAYGFSKSQEKVKSSFKSAFMEIYKGLGMKKGEGMILSFDKTDFTTKTGLASAYEQLLAYVTAPERIGKYTKEAASQIEKALADVRASIGVDVQVRIREDFEREMEDAFNNYELTLDLQKLNLPSDLMEDMFNIESVDTTTLRQKITDFYNDMRSEGVSIEIADYDNLVKQFSDVNKSEEERTEIISKLNDKYGEYIGFIVSETTSLEALAAVQGKVKTKLLESGGDVDRTDMEKIEQYIKKIDDMEKKAQRDRIKEYAKYLEYELSERAKISMDYAKKIADVQTERSIPVDKRDKIIAGLVKERDEKLAKQDWEDFKGSEVYVQMMEDLEKHGTAALKSMREELELIRKNAKNLSPRALKEVVTAIEKIRDIELNRMDPFVGLKNSIADVKESLANAGVSSKGELYAEADANEKNLVITRRRKQEVDRIVAAQDRAVEIQKELNRLMKYQEISDIKYNSDIPIEKEIDAYKDLLKQYEDQLDKLSDEDKNLVKERLALAKEMGRISDEETRDTTTGNRKAEITARKQEIEKRVNQIDQLLDGNTIGQNMANGIIDAIKQVIKLRGELARISEKDQNDTGAKDRQNQLSEEEKRLMSLQDKYNKAIQSIDNYNKQVQRMVSLVGEWTSKVQGLWSELTNLTGAYEGEFGKWIGRWGKVIDVSLQQIGNLTKAFGEFRNSIAEYQKSATKKAADKAIGELGNVAEAENTAKENENTDAVNRNTTSRADNTVNVIANTAAIKANTEAKIENANAGNTNGGNNNGDNVKEAAKGLVESTNSINKSTETASEVGSTVATTSNTEATQLNTAAKLENAAASGLASAGNAAVGATAEAATPAVATFGSTLTAVMGWVGLIAAGLSALMSVITAIAGAHDDDIEEDIEREQRKIDELKRAYERLEKQIQKTWSSLDYMDTYDRQVENVKRQIEAMERQLALERDKKDTDESKIISYQEAIDDAYDELDELKQKQIEVFGGIGEEGYRSAAEGFVDAWKEAFLETGDGLQGLQDHFDEFLQEWFVKQATMRIAGKMLEQVFTQIDKAVDKYSDGGTSAMLSEIQNVKDMASAIFPDLSEALEELAGMFDLQGEGGLSGLAAGIQGMTEEQANILEAYWNSVRMYTANIDVNVERIASILGAGGINTNPMLDKLDSIINNTAYIKRIYDMLEPLQTNNGSGRGFRTYQM